MAPANTTRAALSLWTLPQWKNKYILKNLQFYSLNCRHRSLLKCHMCGIQHGRRGQQMVVSSGYLTGSKLRTQLQRIDVLGWGARLSVRFPQPFVRAHAGRNRIEVWPLAGGLLPVKFVSHLILERAEVVADPRLPVSHQSCTLGATRARCDVAALLPALQAAFRARTQ